MMRIVTIDYLVIGCKVLPLFFCDKRPLPLPEFDGDSGA
jgi:hypothetical protein